LDFALVQGDGRWPIDPKSMGGGQEARALLVTAEQAVERLHLRVAWLCAVMRLLEGYEIAAVGYAIPTLVDAWRVAPAGFTQVLAPGNIGLLLGSLCVGRRAGDAGVANASNLRRPRYRGIFRDAVDGNPRRRAARLVSWVTPANGTDARQPHLHTPPPRPYARSTQARLRTKIPIAPAAPNLPPARFRALAFSDAGRPTTSISPRSGPTACTNRDATAFSAATRLI
jgi:hypothetical protein